MWERSSEGGRVEKNREKQEHQDKLKETYDGVKEREVGELEEEWGLMKESFVGHASDVCGERFVGGYMRRVSEWWNKGMKMTVEEKKRALEEWLQCNSMEKYERYREKNVEILNGDRILISRIRRMKRSFGR